MKAWQALRIVNRVIDQGELDAELPEALKVLNISNAEFAECLKNLAADRPIKPVRRNPREVPSGLLLKMGYEVGDASLPFDTSDMPPHFTRKQWVLRSSHTLH